MFCTFDQRWASSVRCLALSGHKAPLRARRGLLEVLRLSAVKLVKMTGNPAVRQLADNANPKEPIMQ
jgi:hypothetical protein